MNDTIEKTTILKAPLAKVWKAISDSEAFGTSRSAGTPGSILTLAPTRR